MIKTIPMWKMMLATKGKILGLVILAFLPVFIIGGAWMFVEGLQNGKMRQAAMGLLCLIFFWWRHLARGIFEKICSRQNLSGI